MMLRTVQGRRICPCTSFLFLTKLMSLPRMSGEIKIKESRTSLRKLANKN